MLVVLEGRKPYCWVCGLLGHLAKACPGRKVTPAVAATTSTEPNKAPGVWKEMVTKRRKQKAGHFSPEGRPTETIIAAAAYQEEIKLRSSSNKCRSPAKSDNGMEVEEVPPT